MTRSARRNKIKNAIRDQRIEAATIQRQTPTFPGVHFSDAFSNPLARLGFGTPNLMNGTQYPLTRLSNNYNLLTSLYRNNWIIRHCMEIIPEDMLKNRWQYVCDLKQQDIDKLYRAENETRIIPQLFDGLVWGRVYGGGGALMLIDGQEDILDQPLDYDSIMPGDFKGLHTVDRWMGIFPENQFVSDINSPEYGLPEMYYFNVGSGASQERVHVHHSRVLRFVGGRLPIQEKMAQMYWGVSEIECIFQEIERLDNTGANLANLIFLANIHVRKNNVLSSVLAGANDQVQAQLGRTMELQNILKNNFSTLLLGPEEDYAIHNSSMADMPATMELFMSLMSGATRIPKTKLFGESPAGLNSTGEGDMKNYYGVIKSKQTHHLKPCLDKLTPVICLSTLGRIPDDLETMFNPPYVPTDEEKGAKLKAQTDAIYGAFDRGLISPRTTLMELKTNSDEFGVFTNITEEDIEAADSKPIDPMEQIPPGGEDDSDESIPSEKTSKAV